MQVTGLATSPGGSAREDYWWPLDEALGAPPLRSFRAKGYMRFVLRGADRIVFDESATAVSGWFSSRDLDALAAAWTPAPALVAGEDKSVVVDLHEPREVVRVDLAQGKAGFTLHRVDGSKIAPMTTSGTSGAGVTDAFAAARFAVKADGGLSTSDVKGVRVRAYPTGARLGIAPAADPSSPSFFWRSPGEARGGLAVDAGAALVAELERYFDALDPPLPRDYVDVLFVIESDAPCGLYLWGVSVGYGLERERFASTEADKRVVRFGGTKAEAREVELEIPAGAQVRSGKLRAVESFAADRPAAAEGPPDLSGDTGLYVGGDASTRASIEPAEALVATGLSLGLVALADDTTVLVELQEDWQGAPSGRQLAAGRIELPRGVERTWATVLFSDETTLFPQPYWLLLRAATGHAVLLFGTDGKPLHGLLTEPGGEVEQAATLAVDSTTVERQEDGDSSFYDLTTALQAATPAGDKIPLVFNAAVPGQVTVYPPVIEYDL